MCRHLGHALSNSSEYGAPVHWFSIKVIDWMIGLTNRTDLRLQCRGCYGHAIIYASIWKHMRISSSTLICFSLSLSLTPGLFLFFLFMSLCPTLFTRSHLAKRRIFNGSLFLFFFCYFSVSSIWLHLLQQVRKCSTFVFKVWYRARRLHFLICFVKV